MIKPFFTIKNIIIFILLLPVCSLLWRIVFGSIFMIFTEGAQLTLFLFLPWFYIATKICAQQVIPRYFICMKAVRKYISFKELKQIIEKEEFIKEEFPQFETRLKKNFFGKSKYELYYSRNWVFAKGVYIPKAMIKDANSERGGDIKFSLINNKTIYIGCVGESACHAIESYLKKGKDIPNIKLARNMQHNDEIYQSYLKHYKEKFKAEIKTKSDFMKLIEKDHYFEKTFKAEKEKPDTYRFFYDERGVLCKEITEHDIEYSYVVEADISEVGDSKIYQLDDIY